MREKHNRVLAFLIDIMLVTFLTICICEVHYINPYVYEYEEALEKYSEDYNKVYELVYDDENVDTFVNTITPSLYNVEQKSMYLSIWYLIFYYLYFGVFAYFNNGQTLGKKIFKLKIVDEKGEKPSYARLSFRCLINGSSMFLGVNIITLIKLFALLLGKTTAYFAAYTLLSMFGLIIEFVLILTFLINKDNRAINDLVFKTRVVSIK